MRSLLLLPASLNFSNSKRLRRSTTQPLRGRNLNPSIKTTITMSSFMSKKVWIWTENKSVMTAAVERGWNTFIFTSQELAREWSSIALLETLLLKENGVVDCDDRKVATVVDVASQKELVELQQCDDNLVINFHDWQIIPAENIVAAFQGSQKTIFAVSKTSSEAQVFLEALENGLGGVVLKVDEIDEIVRLKEYFDKRNESSNLIGLTTATVTKIYAVGMGDRVCVDLCSLMKPGEGILVGSFARGLFLVHSECLESNYIASRPFRVNAGPVHAYVAVPGGKTNYLSELRTGNEVIVVDQTGRQRTAIVGRVKIETRPLILIEAKIDSDTTTSFSILLQNAETVALIRPSQGNGENKCAIPVTSLKVGDTVTMKVQGGARHTGIEIQEFILEK